VFVAAASRAEQPAPAFLHFSLFSSYHARLPQPALLVFITAVCVLLVRLLRFHKVTESGLLWSLVATWLGFQAGGAGKIGTAYFGTAALVLASSIVENSYLLAYHDELTSLPSRRAFNDALLRLKAPYSIAVVDIDHFKRFNDTYGHDTGDQVLRMVATNLGSVTGGGKAYRCGGEEFNILFPGKTTAEVLPHLEKLRVTVAKSEFRMRGNDRRQLPRGPDRRNQRNRARARKGDAIRRLAEGKPS